MLYNTDGCHGKFLKYQIQVKNEIVLIPPISGSLCDPIFHFADPVPGEVAGVGQGGGSDLGAPGAPTGS